MKFNFRNIDGDKFIGEVEQTSDYLNVLKFFNEEKIPMTFVTYKEYKDEDVYEDYIIEDFYLASLQDVNYKYDSYVIVRLRKDED